jgi:hypothetical protein
MVRALLFGSLMVAAGAGCGEVESLVLEVRPSQSEFDDVQTQMLELGCGVPGCHAVVVGNFQVTEPPKSGAQRETEYLLTKAHVNLDAPEQSKLLRIALAGDPEQIGHPACYPTDCSCAYQAIYNWIAAPITVDCPGDCVPDGC